MQQIENWENIEKLRKPNHLIEKEGCSTLMVVELDEFLKVFSKKNSIYHLKRDVANENSENDKIKKSKKSTENSQKRKNALRDYYIAQDSNIYASTDSNTALSIYDSTTQMYLESKTSHFYDTTIKSTYPSFSSHTLPSSSLLHSRLEVSERLHQSYHFPWRHLPIPNLLKTSSPLLNHPVSFSHKSHFNSRLEKVFQAWRNKSISEL